MKMQRWMKIALISPFVVVWDILFTVVTKIHHYMSVVDEAGGTVIDNFLEDDS